jgi:tRNA(His) 5'-end guanylyltransferase
LPSQTVFDFTEFDGETCQVTLSFEKWQTLSAVVTSGTAPFSGRERMIHSHHTSEHSQHHLGLREI